MSIATSKIGNSFSTFVDRLGSKLKADFEQALASNGKARTPAAGRPAASGGGSRSSATFLAPQLSSLFAGSVLRAPVVVPNEEVAPKITAEPPRYEGNILGPDSVLHAFRIEGSDGQTFCRVEVDTEYNTTTVYDNDNKTIIRFNGDGGLEKGEAWTDGFDIYERSLVYLRSDDITVILYPNERDPAVGINVVRREKITYVDGENLNESFKKERVEIFGLRDEDATKHPDRDWSGDYVNLARIVPFGRFGNLGYTVASEVTPPTVIGKFSIDPMRAE